MLVVMYMLTPMQTNMPPQPIRKSLPGSRRNVRHVPAKHSIYLSFFATLSFAPLTVILSVSEESLSPCPAALRHERPFVMPGTDLASLYSLLSTLYSLLSTLYSLLSTLMHRTSLFTFFPIPSFRATARSTATLNQYVHPFNLRAW